uniref:tRNA-uridine aminocarboxypropyltransferase n=1 Tax=Glossina pallidipes TaxID=7398 RepID=A0A1A9ZJN5_GLOPL
MRQVKLMAAGCSDYIIRTQSTGECLSTLEMAAQSLASSEDRTELRELLVKRLHMVCTYQVDNEAVEHQSKEFRIKHQQYPNRLVNV